MNPIYCKYSNDRAERFKIKTMIQMEPDGTRSVWKTQWNEAAKEHVDKIYLHYLQMKESFDGGILEPNLCEKTESGVKLEFVEGETLEQYLDSLYSEGRYVEIVEEMKKYRDILYSLPDNIPFRYTEEFDAVFGKETEFSNCDSLKISNIDLVFGNIIPFGHSYGSLESPSRERKNRWVIIDYEWIFDFPVPINFIIYRAIHYYLYSSTKRKELLDFHVFKLLGISDEEQAVYEAMERSFQAYVAGEKSTMPQLKALMLKHCLDAKEGILDTKTDFVQFYMDDGSGYSEEHSLKFTYSYMDGIITAKICLPEGTTKLRIDPASSEVIIKGLMISGDGAKLWPDETNGYKLSEGAYVFWEEDAQFLLNNVKGIKEVTVYFSVVTLRGTRSEELMTLAEKIEELQKQCEEREAENMEIGRQCREMSGYIEELHRKFLWRVYSRIKRIFKGQQR